MPKGDCFQVALHLVLEDPSLTLCHGLPVGQDGPPGSTATPGERYWHAWVERTDELLMMNHEEPITITTAIDRSNDKDITMPAVMYRKIGRMEEDDIFTYTGEEARVMMLEFKHYGPWVDPEFPPAADWVDE